jgi:hypothetical protein
MVGVAARLTRSPITSLADVRAAYEKLFSNDEYREATTRATADEENVSNRVKLAKAAFANVP